jgi:hypothetical protein
LRRAPVLRDFATRFPSSWMHKHSQDTWTLTQNVTTTVAGSCWKDTAGGYAHRSDRYERRRSPHLSTQYSNANRAFRTLRRMLNMAVEWKLLRAAPKIKELEEFGRTALLESSTEACFSPKA